MGEYQGTEAASGISAGGALSALLGASADTPGHQPYLDALGAADGSDRLFVTGSGCPTNDLDQTDAALEWRWRAHPPADGATAGPTLSQSLATLAARTEALGDSTSFRMYW